MGTRNLSLLKENNKLIIAQYGQWDGYPSGQGKTVLEFCKTDGNIERLRSLTKSIKWSEDFDKWNEYAEYFDNNSNKKKEDLDYFNKFISRDVSANIFQNIIDLDFNTLPNIFDKTLCLKKYDELEKTKNYCDIWIEYAYLINLDTNELECYAYKKLLKKYSLLNLPSVEIFIKELKELEEVE